MLAAGYRINRRNVLKAEADALEDRQVRVERMLEVIRATRDRQDARFLPEHLLPVIHNSLPDNVYLDSLEVDASRSRISMGGSAPSRKDIREFIRLLEESPFFEGVEEGGRTAMDQDERFVFQVVGRFEEGQPR
jgi:Tfp pilus assembly protein PilN